MKFEEVLPALRKGKTLKCTIRDVVWIVPSHEFNSDFIVSSEMILDGVWEIEKPKDYARMFRDGSSIAVRMKSDLSLDDSYNDWIGDWVELPNE